jgi:hypothetical protein
VKCSFVVYLTSKLQHNFKQLLTLEKLPMALSKIFRSAFAVILTCVIALNGFTGSAFADSRSTTNLFLQTNSLAFFNFSSLVDSLVTGFWQGLGGAIGGATGTIAACYAVDFLVAPVAPPAAAYLAGMCPGIGLAVGGGTGLMVASPK